MGIKSVKDCISLFFSLCSSEKINSDLAQKYYERTEGLLKLFWTLFEIVVDTELVSKESFKEALIELVQLIDHLRGIIETGNPLMSKLYFVIRMEEHIMKTQICCLNILQMMEPNEQSFPSELSRASLQLCIEEMKRFCHEHPSALTKHSIEADMAVESMLKITDALGLTSSPDLLLEAAALEQLKKDHDTQKHEEEEKEEVKEDGWNPDKMISLVTQVRDHLVLSKLSLSFGSIPVPAGMCCPLSLELMTDPVIIDSGETYERSFIRKWFQSGLTICPKTRKPLSHTNLTPNIFVKSFIQNWCDADPIRHPLSVSAPVSDDARSTRLSKPSSPGGDPAVSTSYGTGSPGAEPERRSGRRFSRRVLGITLPSPEEAGAGGRVRKLVDELCGGGSAEQRRERVGELRRLSKKDEERAAIAGSGAIPFLVHLLSCEDEETKEHAATTLLNLSITEANKSMIVGCGAVGPLIDVLETGSPEARENSAATLLSLSMVRDNAIIIGNAGAVLPLVGLLGSGSPRGRKDAVTVLFNLSRYRDSVASILGTDDVVRRLVALTDPAAGVVDKAVAVLSNLCATPEGREKVGEGAGIGALVEVVELGTSRGKENAAAALFQLCTHSEVFCRKAIREGAVPPVVSLSRSGTPRAKEKANGLMSCFKKQWRGNSSGTRQVTFSSGE